MHVYVVIYVGMHVYVVIYVCMHVYVCMHIYMHIICIYVYICMYVCIYICMYACIYIHTWSEREKEECIPIYTERDIQRERERDPCIWVQRSRGTNLHTHTHTIFVFVNIYVQIIFFFCMAGIFVCSYNAISVPWHDTIFLFEHMYNTFFFLHGRYICVQLPRDISSGAGLRCCLCRRHLECRQAPSLVPNVTNFLKIYVLNERPQMLPL